MIEVHAARQRGQARHLTYEILIQRGAVPSRFPTAIRPSCSVRPPTVRGVSGSRTRWTAQRGQRWSTTGKKSTSAETNSASLSSSSGKARWSCCVWGFLHSSCGPVHATPLSAAPRRILSPRRRACRISGRKLRNGRPRARFRSFQAWRSDEPTRSALCTACGQATRCNQDPEARQSSNFPGSASGWCSVWPVQLRSL
jgi:hypothetical protein